MTEAKHEKILGINEQSGHAIDTRGTQVFGQKKQSTSPRTSTGKDDFFLKGAQALAGCELGTAAEQR